MAHHEGRLDYRPSGLVVPEVSEFSRFVGVVVALPEDGGDCGLKFGDIVELPRWGGVWFFRPGITFGASVSSAQEVEYCDPDSDRCYVARTDDLMTFRTVDQIMYKIGAVDGTLEPGVYPVGRRILVRKVEEPRMTASGLELPDWRFKRWAYGQIEDAGTQVSDLPVGGWILTEPECGSHFKIDGASYAIVHENDVYGYWPDGQQPEWAEVRD